MSEWELEKEDPKERQRNTRSAVVGKIGGGRVQQCIEQHNTALHSTSHHTGRGRGSGRCSGRRFGR